MFLKNIFILNLNCKRGRLQRGGDAADRRGRLQRGRGHFQRGGVI